MNPFTCWQPKSIASRTLRFLTFPVQRSFREQSILIVLDCLWFLPVLLLDPKLNWLGNRRLRLLPERPLPSLNICPNISLNISASPSAPSKESGKPKFVSKNVPSLVPEGKLGPPLNPVLPPRSALGGWTESPVIPYISYKSLFFLSLRISYAELISYCYNKLKNTEQHEYTSIHQEFIFNTIYFKFLFTLLCICWVLVWMILKTN